MNHLIIAPILLPLITAVVLILLSGRRALIRTLTFTVLSLP